MKEPNWQGCTEQELGWHLEGAGIQSVLVGGAVVSIYTEGLYRSGDLDLIPDDAGRTRLPGVLAELGFEPSRSRYYKHPECPHLFLEFPRGPVEIGEQFPVTPAEVEVEGRILRLLSPTDSVKDRLAGYIHWNSRANFDQAVLICRRQKESVELGLVEEWCSNEGGVSAFKELTEKLRERD